MIIMLIVPVKTMSLHVWHDIMSREFICLHISFVWLSTKHYNDVIMGTMASQITSLTSVYSTVYSGVDQRKHQRTASLAFVWGIHRGPVNSPHKWPVTREMFPFDEVIMNHSLGNDNNNSTQIPADKQKKLICTQIRIFNSQKLSISTNLLMFIK